jgi:hypothetical protein
MERKNSENQSQLRLLIDSLSAQTIGPADNVVEYLVRHLREIAQGKMDEPQDQPGVVSRLDRIGGNDKSSEKSGKMTVREQCVAVWMQAHKDLRGDDELPGMFENALNMAATDGEEQKVLAVVERLVQTARVGTKGSSKMPLVAEICRNDDPSLFFDFLRQPLKIDETFLRETTDVLKGLCPKRDRQIEEIAMFVGRRLLGDEDALYPLLWGPPGTGKTFLVELLGEVFTSAKIVTKSIIQPMTQMGHSLHNNEIGMTLQGTSSHWGEGRPGMLFAETSRRKTALCLTVLDEVDKCSHFDYLVTLLDPRQPLQDNFVREFFPGVDLRHKCLFFLTANDTSGLSSGANAALWSRLQPIEMPEYSREEIADLVVNLVGRRLADEDKVERGELQKISRRVMDAYPAPPSVRTIIDGVKRQLFQRRFPFLRGVDQADRNAAGNGNSIGFQCLRKPDKSL